MQKLENVASSWWPFDYMNEITPGEIICSQSGTDCLFFPVTASYVRAVSWFVQLQTNKIQGLFKDKKWFSRLSFIHKSKLFDPFS